MIAIMKRRVNKSHRQTMPSSSASIRIIRAKTKRKKRAKTIRLRQGLVLTRAILIAKRNRSTRTIKENKISIKREAQPTRQILRMFRSRRTIWSSAQAKSSPHFSVNWVEAAIILTWHQQALFKADRMQPHRILIRVRPSKCNDDFIFLVRNSGPLNQILWITRIFLSSVNELESAQLFVIEETVMDDFKDS